MLQLNFHSSCIPVGFLLSFSVMNYSKVKGGTLKWALEFCFVQHIYCAQKRNVQHACTLLWNRSSSAVSTVCVVRGIVVVRGLWHRTPCHSLSYAVSIRVHLSPHSIIWWVGTLDSGPRHAVTLLYHDLTANFLTVLSQLLHHPLGIASRHTFAPHPHTPFS